MNQKKQKMVTGNDCVKIHFSLCLADGTVVDGTILDSEDETANQPMLFCLGDGSMISAFESLIIGMQVGEQRQATFDPRDTFGFPDESNYHWIEREKFQSLGEQDLQVGLIIEFDTPAGDKVPGMVLEIRQDQVLIDFNHPLAGKSLIFSVELLEILSAGGSS